MGVTQGGADVATKDAGGAAATTGGVADSGDQQAQLQESWTAFVKWFRSNGGIISSKLTVKVCVCQGLGGCEEHPPELALAAS